MASPRTYRVTLRCVVEIPENDPPTVDLPAIDVQLEYGLNSIPTAYISVGVGFDLLTRQASPIHTIYDKLTAETGVKVYLHLLPSNETLKELGDDAYLGIPKDYKPFLVFEGRLTAKSPHRVRADNASSARCVLSCVHWLADLAESSTLSYESHPLNPSQYTYGALLPGSQTGAKNWTGITATSTYATPVNIRTDFWGKCVRPFLEEVMKGNTLQIAELGVTGTAANTPGITALSRFQTPATPAGINNFYCPLGLSVGIEAEVANRLMEDLSGQILTPENLAHQTVWDVLVSQLAQQYLFAVVPRVTDALVIPYVPTMRTVYTTLGADTISIQRLSQTTASRIRAVGIQSGTVGQTGADMLPGGIPDNQRLGLGGWFEHGTKGIILIQVCPRWMTGLLTPSIHSQQTSGGGGAVKATAMHPQAGTADPARDNINAVMTNQIKPLLDRYAEAVYELESLKGRQLTIVSVPRFDIAPGSCVAIEALLPGNAADQLAVKYVATVLQVSYVFSVSPATASMTLQLSHFRTEAENATEAYTSEKHPLWDVKNFSGCTLVDQQE